MKVWRKRSGKENAKYVEATDEIVGSWPHQRRIGSTWSQRIEMGTDARARMAMVRCRVWPISGHCFAPQAWEEIGSIPIARPDKTEKPVMLAIPMAREPPANVSFPIRPMKSMDIADFP